MLNLRILKDAVILCLPESIINPVRLNPEACEIALFIAQFLKNV